MWYKIVRDFKSQQPVFISLNNPWSIRHGLFYDMENSFEFPLL